MRMALVMRLSQSHLKISDNPGSSWSQTLEQPCHSLSLPSDRSITASLTASKRNVSNPQLHLALGFETIPSAGLPGLEGL